MTQRDLERATAERLHDESAARRERLRAARYAVVMAAVAESVARAAAPAQDAKPFTERDAQWLAWIEEERRNCTHPNRPYLTTDYVLRMLDRLRARAGVMDEEKT